MQKNGQQSFELDKPPVARIERLHERGRRSVELKNTQSQQNREKDDDEVRAHHHHPVHAGNNAVELEPAQHAIFIAEVQIKGLVVRPIPPLVTEVPLANQVIGSRKEQRHPGTQHVVHNRVWVKHAVFGFVDDGVHRIADNPKADGKQGQLPPRRCRGDAVEKRCERDKLTSDNQEITSGRNRKTTLVKGPFHGPFSLNSVDGTAGHSASRASPQNDQPT